MINVFLQNREPGGGEVLEISSLIGTLQITTHLHNQPDKATFTIEEDPTNLLKITNGSIIAILQNGSGIFFGYVFSMGSDNTVTYKISAYNQKRYLKNEDTQYLGNLSASDIFGFLCTKYNLNYTVVTPSNWIVPEKLYSKKSLYTMIEESIQRTNTATGKYYFIRDNYGTLEFTELEEHKTDLIIGDNSLLVNYDYEISIDQDTYNRVKIVRDNQETGKRDVWYTNHSENERKWGILQYLLEANENLTHPQIVQLGEDIMKWKNRETQKLSLTALRVPELIAGTGFTLKIDKLGISQDMWIMNATHTIQKDYETMSLEVFI